MKNFYLRQKNRFKEKFNLEKSEKITGKKGISKKSMDRFIRDMDGLTQLFGKSTPDMDVERKKEKDKYNMEKAM